MLKLLISSFVFILSLQSLPLLANDALPQNLNWLYQYQEPAPSNNSSSPPPVNQSSSGNSAAVPLSQALTPLNRACLPLAGRMLRNEAASCHCPPQSLCPYTIADWQEAKKLPPDIANICCNRPKECTFERINVAACGLGNSLSTSIEQYCYKYEVKPFDDKVENNENYKIAYKDANDKLKLINNKFAELHEELGQLAYSNDSTGQVFNQAMAIINKIRAELLKVNDLNNSMVKMVCKDNSKPTFCTKQISDSCPIPPGDPECGDVSAIVNVPDRQGWFETTPTKCWCPTGRILDFTAGRESMRPTPNSKYLLCAIAGDCVLKETKISMADGGFKNIEDIKVGDFVKGYMSINKVLAVTLNEEENLLYAINDNKLIITAGHPILTRKGWKAIDVGMVIGDSSFTKQLKKLEVGDEILMTDESVIVVTSLQVHEQKNAQKYNLSVGGDTTFTANGMIIRAFKANTTY